MRAKDLVSEDRSMKIECLVFDAKAVWSPDGAKDAVSGGHFLSFSTNLSHFCGWGATL